MYHLTARHFVCLLILIVFIGASSAQAQLRADFTVDKTGGCSPLIASFTNRTTGASANAIYRWEFGNGNTSALQNPGAIFKQEQTYTVTLTVKDGSQTSTRSLNITVFKKPTVDFSVTDARICLPEMASFISTSSAGDGSISSYHWDFGDGTTQQGFSSQMSHSYNYVQKPTVSLTVTNSYGCYNSATKSNLLDVMPRMNAAFTTDKTLFCNASDEVKFTNSSTGPGTLSYSWNFGDGNTASGKDAAHVYNKKGLYNARMTVTNEDGCSATASSSTINIAYFNTNFSTPSMLCRQIGFTSSSYLSPSASLWKFGDGSTGNSLYSATHTYAAAGTYTVELINTYGACKDTIAKEIVVNDNVNYNSDFTVPAVLCEDNYYTFTSRSSTPPGNILWDFGDGRTSGFSTSVSHVYSTPGTYTVKLVNTFGTCKETVTKDITVHALPDPRGFIADLSGLCGAPVNVQFKDTTPGAVAWQWTLDYIYPGYITSALKEPLQPYATDGSRLVTLMVTNAAGCSKSVSKLVNISRPSVNIYATNTTFPSGIQNCGTVSAKFHTTSSEAITDYQWHFGDGSFSSETSPEHSFTNPGVYTVQLSYTTINGCKGTATYGAIRVYAKPKADFDYTVPPCVQAVTVQFSNRSVSYTDTYWDFGDRSGSFYTSSPVHTYRDTGLYSVRMIAYNGGCTDTIRKDVYTNVLPAFVSIRTAQNTCAGTRGTVTFEQTSLRATGGTWDFGDGTTIPYDTSRRIVTHTYTRTGTYQVTLTGTYGSCPLVSGTTVKVLLKQSPVLTSNKTELCSNETVNVQVSNLDTNPFAVNSEFYQYGVNRFEYEDRSAFNGYISNYTWNYTSYSTNLNNIKSGDRKLRMIIYSNSCLDTTNYISLKVNGPAAGFKITTNNVCYKSPIVFEDTSKTVTNVPIKTWQWNFGDKIETYTKGGVVEHLYNNPGNYYVSLTVTDANGCSSTTSSAVLANPRGPVANFAATGLFVPNVPLNTTVTFNNYTNYFANSATYLWNYGDGATSTAYGGSHTYTAPGVNTVRLIVNDPVINCADTAEQVITVKNFNTAFNFTSSYLTNNNCPPVLVRFNNISSGTIRVVWDFGDGIKSDNQFNPTHTYYKPGLYKITLETYGHNGLTGVYYDSIEVKAPLTNLRADVLSGCTSQSVTLHSNVKGAASYTWDFGDGTVAQSRDSFYVHKFVTGGVYQPTLIMKDAGGCAVTTALNNKIIIDSLHIAIKGIPAKICDSAQVNFTPDVISIAADEAAQTLVYKWNFGTGNAKDTANTKNAAFAYSQPGSYQVKFRVESPYGCVKETTDFLTVYGSRKFQMNTVTDTFVCAGKSLLLKAANASSYAWINNTAGLNNTSASSVIATPPGNVAYTVVGYDANKCFSDTDHIRVVVHQPPVVNAGPDQKVSPGTPVQLQASGSADITSWLWSPANDLSCSDCQTPLSSTATPTTYVVTGKTPYGCAASDSMRLRFFCSEGIFIPNSFTPNNDGKNDVFALIGKTVDMVKSLRIYNRWGELIFERTNFSIDDRAATWNGKHKGVLVPQGTYIYMAQLQCDAGEVYSKEGTVTVVY